MADRQLSDDQKLDWLQLILSENVGPATFKRLINHFGGAAMALEALPELSRHGGLGRKIKLYPRNKAQADLQKIGKLGARLIAMGERDYPSSLNQIDTAPPLLCIKGKAELMHRPKVAMVGARNASALGRKFARQLANELSKSGFVIVSGLARGIDTAAHEASVEGGTIAVLAGGIDNIYPPENHNLHEQIAGQGVLVCEHPPGYQPQSHDFPRRNRLISGMSFGVIIVEAAKRSGSLITARFALEQGREVFAVPGSPLDPRAAGTNSLIQQGAVLTTSANDVISVLSPMAEGLQGLEQQFQEHKEDEINMLSSAEISDNTRIRVMDSLGVSPVGIDDLARECEITPSELHTILVEMELAGRLSRHSNHTVSLN